MIPKISGNGKSFKGLSDYLTHDPDKAKTAERVAWTHTHNLANDDVPSAVNEMYLTAENAELLKQEAGIRAGGRATENPVKHISLNWAPGDNPSREHMIETSQSYLHHMGWHEHQAIFIAHEDKSYKHVHIMLNAVHPETGLRLNDGYEQLRSQTWALQYEREQGRIHCEQRLKAEEERENNMPRNIWMAFKANEQEFARAEKKMADNSPEIPKNPKNAEWEILKDLHLTERTQHFAQGKIEFSELRQSIYREVREEFRERWADYFKADKNTVGEDRRFLSDVKAQIIADQKAVLEPRRDQACAELREARDGRYQQILGWQRDDRAELTKRQEFGLDNTEFFERVEGRQTSAHEMASGFREAAAEFGSRKETAGRTETVKEMTHSEAAEPSTGAGAADKDTGIGGRIAGGIGGFFDSLFFDLTTLGSARPEPVSKEAREDVFREAAENALKQHQQQARDVEDAAWRERQKTLFGE